MVLTVSRERANLPGRRVRHPRMTDPVELTLTEKQQQFLAHACAFIATHPAQLELDQLLTLARMLLPPPHVEMLAKQAAEPANPSPDEPQSAHWLK